VVERGTHPESIEGIAVFLETVLKATGLTGKKTSGCGNGLSED